MQLNLKKLTHLTRAAIAAWGNDNASLMAAALAYYTLFSLSPLLVILIAVAGLFFGEAAARGEIVAQISHLTGANGAEAIQAMINNANRPGAGLTASIFGGITLFLGASGVFSQLQSALNHIWQVPQEKLSGILPQLKQRFLSFSAVIGIGFLMSTSLLFSAAVSAIARFIADTLPFLATILPLIDLLLSFLLLTFLFAVTFKFMPNLPLSWKEVAPGSMVTAILFVLGKYLISLYLSFSSVGSAYGAAGSLVVLLVWIYYSAQIILFGAEWTKVYKWARDGQLAEKLPQIK